MTTLRVAAVILTHNRRAVLAETLRAACAQTRAPDGVYVVDNASEDGTSELLRTEFSDVTHVRMPENLGSSGGAARGIQVAGAARFDAFWLMDDDSPPQRDALDTLLAALESSSTNVGIVGCRGGMVRFGWIRHFADAQLIGPGREYDGAFVADFVELSGSLILRSVVDSVGVPRPDFFMMIEPIEYSLRARRASIHVLLTRRDLMHRGYVVESEDPWRGYYQSRNHLRMALDFRSPALLLGWAARQVRFIIGELRLPDRRWERIRLRLRGIWDGLRGRMGRRVEPDAASR